MVLFPGPVEFLMGSPATEKDRTSFESLHRKRIGRRFAIATKEVTVKQFQELLRNTSSVRYQYRKKNAPEENCPQIAVTWYEAAAYCNWLSEQEGIREENWCYEQNDEGEYASGMSAKENFLELTGYRLPTEAEWEFACRAGATTGQYYGLNERLLTEYAWYNENSNELTWPVASLKPNDFGMFDMLGNVREWCHDEYALYPSEVDQPADDRLVAETVTDQERRVSHGGSFDVGAQTVRSAKRSFISPDIRGDDLGFRAARTYP